MDEEQALQEFGFPAQVEDLPRLRRILLQETKKEMVSQGKGDTELMKLLCAQLFVAGEVSDCLLVWAAKSASMDADCSIDMQLVLGAGLEPTVEYLKSLDDNPSALTALKGIAQYVKTGQYDDLSSSLTPEYWSRYYGK